MNGPAGVPVASLRTMILLPETRTSLKSKRRSGTREIRPLQRSIVASLVSQRLLRAQFCQSAVGCLQLGADVVR